MENEAEKKAIATSITKVIKDNLEELEFFWTYSYVPEFLQTILKTDDEIDVDQDDLKPFTTLPISLQYAFYCWCVDHNKL